jgi:hypothetical protein
MNTMSLNAVLVGVTLSWMLLGCNSSNAASGEAPASTANAFAAASATPSATKVTKVVFVGKEHACDCTRKAVDAGWAALQNALGTPAKLPVERLQIDTEGSRVEPYRKQKPIMALPALYFLDGTQVVLELLQGEFTEAQVAAVLTR